MKFKLGDVVKYTSNYWYDSKNNPLWGGKYGQIRGQITKISHEKGFNPYYVVWKNDEFNSYLEEDLELVNSSKQLSLF
uniref:Uncharacterized protein n=1 Tax=viral metagenome TaxID=1070528 RepID=A0A6M3LTP9_9ZZZZ